MAKQEQTTAAWVTGEASWNEEGDVRYTLHGIKEARADHCHLIGAAPLLLAALEGMNAWVNRDAPQGMFYCGSDSLNPCYDPIRDAGKPVQHWGSEEGHIIPACIHCTARAAVAKARGAA